MDKKNYTDSKKEKYVRIAILLFCLVISICVSWVLLFLYRPSQNALGALGTVCMDVLSMVVLIIMLVSLILDRKENNKTTQFFHGLLVGSLVALFFDFLNWAFDGALDFSDITYVFTVSSLVMGSVLAFMLCFYLSSYMEDMHDLDVLKKSAKVCGILNVVSFAITLVLGLTKQAFEFTDGHYTTGVLYDVITVIPILTIIFLTGKIVRYWKIIGIHDVIAVVGYIVTMIAGALIEAAYSIGATYVSVAIADIFIFIMLQNKLIDRVKKQREVLAERITSQYEVLESMAGIYSYVNYVDLEEMTVRRFDRNNSVKEKLDLSANPHSELNIILHEGIEDEFKHRFWAYTDLSTLPGRMGKEKIITGEFRHKEDGWLRAQYIRIGDSTEGPLKVIYAIRNINEEKNYVEKWIKRSNTDELTGFFNRHAYEEDLLAFATGRVRENLVYVSMDVNSLKIVNDTLGHEAGDELLIGACECMKRCFGAYGKLYRVGGDEFVALIFADDVQLEGIKKDIKEVTAGWKGKLNDQLTISCGFVSVKEDEEMSLHQMATLADKRMYEDKTEYYRKKGVDRRGQNDAHVALFALYTKILKINVTDNTYKIINMDKEKTKEENLPETLSEWFESFGASGMVHPEDVEDYLTKTNLEYIRNYFKNNKSSIYLLYRRKSGDEYKKVVMEMIPSNDYSDENQSLFLYVKDIE